MLRKTDSRTADKFVIRLPDGYRERLAEVAGERHISMNTVAVEQLETLLFPDKNKMINRPFQVNGNTYITIHDDEGNEVVCYVVHNNNITLKTDRAVIRQMSILEYAKLIAF